MTARTEVIRYLKKHGEIQDQSGRATACLHEAMGCDVSPRALTMVLQQLEKEGSVKRVVRGKRTFSIRLKQDHRKGPRAGRRPKTDTEERLRQQLAAKEELVRAEGARADAAEAALDQARAELAVLRAAPRSRFFLRRAPVATGSRNGTGVGNRH